MDIEVKFGGDLWLDVWRIVVGVREVVEVMLVILGAEPASSFVGRVGVIHRNKGVVLVGIDLWWETVIRKFIIWGSQACFYTGFYRFQVNQQNAKEINATVMT